MNAEQLAEVAGVASVGAVLALGAVARRGPIARRPAADPRFETPRRVVPTAFAFVLAAVLLAASVAVLGVGPSVGVGGVVALAVTRRRRSAKVRRRHDIERSFPDAVELLVLCLHAGRSPVQAIHELAVRAPTATRPGFVAVVGRLGRGAGLADALGALPATLGPCAREVASSIAAADREGLALAPVLDRLAAEARAARRRHGDADARKLPVRLSFPLVVCTLPSFVLLALAPAVIGALSTLRGSSP